jgi:LPPG:FO 2-phospho-L-lactate transferase
MSSTARIRRRRVVLLTGGLGGARLTPHLRDELGPDRLTVIVNVGDDLTWFGLRICPDLDSVLYALAGLWDAGRGWGRRDETFQVRDALDGLGARPWFNVGDRDLAFHLLRAELLRAGATLTEATHELARRLGVTGVVVLPASDEPAETTIVLADGRELHFQEWYVREKADLPVRAVRFPHRPASGAALAALRDADAVVLGPSNPITSIGAILALTGLGTAVRQVPRRIAVSPVVARVAPPTADLRHHTHARRQLLAAVSCADTPGAIAARYANLVDRFVLDRADATDAEQVHRVGLQPVLTDVLDSAALARTLVALIDE